MEYIEWFFTAIVVWLGWALAPVIIFLLIILIFMAAYLFFYVWNKIDDVIYIIKKRFS